MYACNKVSVDSILLYLPMYIPNGRVSGNAHAEITSRTRGRPFVNLLHVASRSMCSLCKDSAPWKSTSLKLLGISHVISEK